MRQNTRVYQRIDATYSPTTSRLSAFRLVCNFRGNASGFLPVVYHSVDALNVDTLSHVCSFHPHHAFVSKLSHHLAPPPIPSRPIIFSPSLFLTLFVSFHSCFKMALYLLPFIRSSSSLYFNLSTIYIYISGRTIFSFFRAFYRV